MRRKDIKKDEFQEFFKKLFQQTKEHKKEVRYAVIGIIAIIAVFAILMLINHFNIKKENKALNKIINLSDNEKKLKKNSKEIVELSEKGKLPTMGILMLSEYYIKSGEYNKANNLIEKINKGDGEINYMKAQLLKIQILSAKSEYNKAIDLYRSKLKNRMEKAKKFPKDTLLYYMAKIFEKKGELESARSIWSKIIEEYPYSSYSPEAREKLERL